MSGSRRSAGPVRQLSLQQPAPRRQQIRRQRSAEDDKSLQIYANPVARGRLGSNAKATNERPKVRMAWTDNRRISEQIGQVEVVARQIPGRSRPTTGKSRVFDKPSILYSRQELAERLRLAWKHREENKANIDIFLTHGTVERCDSQLSTATITAPSTPLGRKDKFEGPGERRKIRGFQGQMSADALSSRECCEKLEEEENSKKDEKIEENDSCVDAEVEVREKEAESVEKRGKDEEEATDPGTDSPAEIKKLTLISIDCTNLHVQSTALPLIKPESAIAKQPKDDFSAARRKRASFQSGTNKAFLVPIRSSTEEPFVSEKIVKEKPPEIVEKILPPRPVVAEIKTPKTLLEVRCGSLAEKTAQKSESKNSFSARSKIENREPLAEDVAGDKAVLKRADTAKIEKPRRTNSAPPQRQLSAGNRVQVNIVIDPNTRDFEKSVCRQEKTEAEGRDEEKDASPKIRSIKSAPLRRRSKSTKRRFWGSCKIDEDSKSRNHSKNSVDARAIDVVTMVSLVSSADSDSDAENSPGDDKLINELRSKLPTTSIIKTSTKPTIVKKPIKSVSFQRESFDEDAPNDQQNPAKEEKKTTQPRFTIVNKRGNAGSLSSSEETVPWRTDIPGLALPVLALIHDVEESIDVPLTDREKRCLAVPIGDLHDKKRKLQRTRSTPSRSEPERQGTMEAKEESPSDPTRVEVTSSQNRTAESSPQKSDLVKRQVEEMSTVPAKETCQQLKTLPSEPHFQTNKEKECWHLYRRMCDKGVYVSFDTVLRGMLTPTEYRLRQKECTQDL